MGSEMCIRDRYILELFGLKKVEMNTGGGRRKHLIYRMSLGESGTLPSVLTADRCYNCFCQADGKFEFSLNFLFFYVLFCFK